MAMKLWSIISSFGRSERTRRLRTSCQFPPAGRAGRESLELAMSNCAQRVKFNNQTKLRNKNNIKRNQIAFKQTQTGGNRCGASRNNKHKQHITNYMLFGLIYVVLTTTTKRTDILSWDAYSAKLVVNTTYVRVEKKIYLRLIYAKDNMMKTWLRINCN